MNSRDHEARGLLDALMGDGRPLLKLTAAAYLGAAMFADVQGEPGQIGSSWRWTWDFLGRQFQGTGRCVEYEAGRRYAFATEGDIASRFTYQAQPQGEGTRLTIGVDFDVPEALAGQEGLDDLLAGAKQRGEEAVERLKAMLEQ